MDNIFVYIIVILVVLALGLYCVQLLPLPGSAGFVKPLLMLLCVALAGYAIARKGGLL